MKSKSQLCKVYNHSEDIIGEYEYNFGLIDKNNPGLYNFSIKYNMNNITITLQKDPSLEKLKIFEVNNYDIKRGSIGFAKKGKPQVRITYFEVKDVFARYEKEKYAIESDLKKVQFGQKESFCNNKFKMLNDARSISICQEPLGYCRLQCSNLKFYIKLHHSCILKCLDK